MKAARVSYAELDQAKAVAEKAGLKLVGYAKSPDGTIKLEFGEFSADNDDWRKGSPLYEGRA